jgi:hypothetical protein
MPKFSRKRYNELVEQLAPSLSQGEVADLLGIGVRSHIRYTRGEAEVPPYLQRLVTMMLKHGIPKEFAQ